MANSNDINIKYLSHVEIETDGTVPGTTVYIANPGEPRVALACVVALAGGGESLEVPGLIADDPEIITLKVRGTVRRIPLRIFEPPVVTSRRARRRSPPAELAPVRSAR